MDDQQKGSQSDITARMKSLTNGSIGVSYRDFEPVLKEMGGITISQCRQVETFATNQLGFWEAAWLFSPAHNPNTVAATEIDGWRVLSRVCTDELVKKVPEVKEQIEKQQSLILLQHCLQRRVDYNKTSPLERVFATVLAKTSFALNAASQA